MGSPAERNARGLDEVAARDEYGGINWGSAFFGWLVAMAMAILLSSIVGAIAAAVGTASDLSQTQAQREAGAIGIGAAVAIAVVLVAAYFAGGYVAGRMSRFDGGKQGMAVWLIGIVVTLLAVALGALFGSQYNILDRVQLPRIPVPTDAATWAGVITAVVLVLGTLLGAVLGGKVGHRYHDKVDRAAHR